MALERKDTIEHLSHPGHPLTYYSAGSIEFRCDGCDLPGNGSTYRCSTCDFVLHEHCGSCPTTFSFILHPHELNLIFRVDPDLYCHVCGTEIDGLFYRCEPCNFNVHPLCTQLPESRRHPLHPDHLLRLQPLSSVSSCRVCDAICTSWGYGCRVCNFDIHLPCVNSPLSKDYSFLTTLMRPPMVLMVLLLAVFVFLITMRKDQIRESYWVQSVYVHRYR